MRCLLDSDSLLYRAGFAANEPGQEGIACWQLDKLIQTVLDDTQCSSYQLYLTGSGNFRYRLYPEYKGNRTNTKRPIHLQVMREYAVEKWGAKVSDGNEADDEVGIAQCTANEDTFIAGLDKDLLTIAGKHYNFNKKEWRELSPLEATRKLYEQLIMGDRADNILGFDGKMRTTVPKFLQWAFDELAQSHTEADMFSHVFSMYEEDVARFSTSVHCLYLQKKENDEWVNPLGMAGFGQKDVLARLSQAPSAQQADDGLPSSNA